jgi:hypothetical protein
MVLKNILNVVNNHYEIIFPMRLIRHSHDSIIESRLIRKEKAISNQYEILERIEFMKNYLIKKRTYERLLKSKFGYVSYTIMSYINYDNNTYTKFGDKFICKYYHQQANVVKFINKLIKEEVFYPQFVNFLINISFFWNNNGFYRRNHVYCDKIIMVLINFMIPAKINIELFTHYYLYH